MLKRISFLFILTLIFAGPAIAGNGHFLHGILPINSAMGGAGVGMPTGVMSALWGNPALMTRLGYIRFETGTEFFKDDLSTTSITAGGVSRTSKSDGEVGVLPGVGWIYHPEGKKFTFGWGLMAAAGFRTNWAPDPQNLMLAPQGPLGTGGFGLLNTELAMTKVTFAAAYDATPKLTFGLAAVVFQGRLAISPNPVVEPDISGTLAAGTFFPVRPMVSGPVTQFGIGAQIGVYYEVSPMISVGASFTTPQNFPRYEWNSVHGNPNNADFLTARKVDIDIDGPPVISLGIGLQPTPKLKIAIDGRWIGYKKTNGIGQPPDDQYKGTSYEGIGGGITPPDEAQVGPAGPLPRYALVSIGWRNILIGMIGAEYKATPIITVRAGVNFNQTPIQSAIALNSGGTPSVFTQHYTGGFSLALDEHFSIDGGFYYTPKNTVTGPFVPGQGTALPSISLTDGIVSGLIGFSASF